MGNEVKDGMRGCIIYGVNYVIEQALTDWEVKDLSNQRSKIIEVSVKCFEKKYDTIGVLEIIDQIFNKIFVIITKDYSSNLVNNTRKYYEDVCKTAKVRTWDLMRSRGLI